MGKKNRRNKQHHSDDEEEEESIKKEADKTNYKDLTFEERREQKRHQAAEKRLAKQKCYVCGKTGHVRRECPGIADDGHGMSRFKKKSDLKQEKQIYQAKKDGRKNNNNNNNSNNDQPYCASVAYPKDFNYPSEDDEQLEQDESIPLVYYDPHCRLTESIEYMRFHRDKKNRISEKEAIQEYQEIWEHATKTTKLSGMILKSTVQANRPWTKPCPLSSNSTSTIPILYVVGLAANVACSTAAEKETAKQLLLDTVAEHSDAIAGLWTELDYTNPKLDRELQLQQLECCLQAAADAQVPLQVQLLPGIPQLLASLDESVAGTDYAQVLLDFQATLMKFSDNDIQIHVVGWHGRSDHMMSLLKHFSGPKTITLYIGLNPSVTFSKATYLHEVAFEVPLHRLLLETCDVIPSDITKSLGRLAAPHAAWWPFVAQAIADHKKTVTLAEVTKAVADNTLELYPKLARNE
jgi:Tat protein secretion system quality control protein TatD with DNase activity